MNLKTETKQKTNLCKNNKINMKNTAETKEVDPDPIGIRIKISIRISDIHSLEVTHVGKTQKLSKERVAKEKVQETPKNLTVKNKKKNKILTIILIKERVPQVT